MYKRQVHWVLKRVAEYAQAHNSQRVAIVHEMSDRKHDVIDAFEYARKRFPDIQMTLNFGAKHEYVPLQAADIVAYEGFKYLERGGVGRPTLSALDPTGQRFRASFYDKHSMSKLVAGLREHLPALIEKEAQFVPPSRSEKL